jgi:hypothetical protein
MEIIAKALNNIPIPSQIISASDFGAKLPPKYVDDDLEYNIIKIKIRKAGIIVNKDMIILHKNLIMVFLQELL